MRPYRHHIDEAFICESLGWARERRVPRIERRLHDEHLDAEYFLYSPIDVFWTIAVAAWGLEDDELLTDFRGRVSWATTMMLDRFDPADICAHGYLSWLHKVGVATDAAAVRAFSTVLEGRPAGESPILDADCADPRRRPLSLLVGSCRCGTVRSDLVTTRSPVPFPACRHRSDRRPR